MTVVQVCARCASQWPVAGAPAQWCPRCQGVLLSPVDTRRPAPVAGRNFRWVARSPYPPEVRRRTDTSPGPTPRYRQIPRWGLLDPPPDEREAPARRTDAVADLAPTLLACTALVFGLATLAEAFRYGLLVFNRVRLVDPLTLAISDAMVWSTELSGPLVAVAAAVAVACRLHVERARVFADRGLTDPRPLREILVGVLVPGLNLVMPAVYLREIAGDDRRLWRAIRLWWTAWVTGGVLVVGNVLWRNQDSLQARADGVVLAAVAAAVGVATALLALLVIRRLDGRDLLGRPHPVTRWINVPRPEEAMAG